MTQPNHSDAEQTPPERGDCPGLGGRKRFTAVDLVKLGAAGPRMALRGGCCWLVPQRGRPFARPRAPRPPPGTWRQYRVSRPTSGERGAAVIHPRSSEQSRTFPGSCTRAACPAHRWSSRRRDRRACFCCYDHAEQSRCVCAPTTRLMRSRRTDDCTWPRSDRRSAGGVTRPGAQGNVPQKIDHGLSRSRV
jgi:hypothetical protein